MVLSKPGFVMVMFSACADNAVTTAATAMQPLSATRLDDLAFMFFLERFYFETRKMEGTWNLSQHFSRLTAAINRLHPFLGGICLHSSGLAAARHETDQTQASQQHCVAFGLGNGVHCQQEGLLLPFDLTVA